MSGGGITYEGALGGGLFAGKKFWFSMRCTFRQRFIQEVEKNGGIVVKLDKMADILVADNQSDNRREHPPVGSVSWRYIERSLKNGVLERLEDHQYNPSDVPGASEASNQRSVGSSAPAKQTRTKYTAAEEQELLIYVTQKERQGAAIHGNEIFKEFARTHPRHTWQSWKDKWDKVLCHRTRPNLDVDALSTAEDRPGISAPPSAPLPVAPSVSPIQARTQIAPLKRKQSKSDAASPSDVLRPINTKLRFTEEDDKLLTDFVRECLAHGRLISGNVIYKELAEEYPHHSFHSWRDRWLRHLSLREPESDESEHDEQTTLAQLQADQKKPRVHEQKTIAPEEPKPTQPSVSQPTPKVTSRPTSTKFDSLADKRAELGSLLAELDAAGPQEKYIAKPTSAVGPLDPTAFSHLRHILTGGSRRQCASSPETVPPHDSFPQSNSQSSRPSEEDKLDKVERKVKVAQQHRAATDIQSACRGHLLRSRLRAFRENLPDLQARAQGSITRRVLASTEDDDDSEMDVDTDVATDADGQQYRTAPEDRAGGVSRGIAPVKRTSNRVTSANEAVVVSDLRVDDETAECLETNGAEMGLKCICGFADQTDFMLSCYQCGTLQHPYCYGYVTQSMWHVCVDCQTTSEQTKTTKEAETPKESKSLKAQFYTCLNWYITEIGKSVNHWPTINGRVIDLWDLYEAVTSLDDGRPAGARSWEDIAEVLGFDWIAAPNVTSQLKDCYTKNLGELEELINGYLAEDVESGTRAEDEPAEELTNPEQPLEDVSDMVEDDDAMRDEGAVAADDSVVEVDAIEHDAAIGSDGAVRDNDTVEHHDGVEHHDAVEYEAMEDEFVADKHVEADVVEADAARTEAVGNDKMSSDEKLFVSDDDPPTDRGYSVYGDTSPTSEREDLAEHEVALPHHEAPKPQLSPEQGPAADRYALPISDNEETVSRYFPQEPWVKQHTQHALDHEPITEIEPGPAYPAKPRQEPEAAPDAPIGSMQLLSQSEMFQSSPPIVRGQKRVHEEDDDSESVDLSYFPRGQGLTSEKVYSYHPTKRRRYTKDVEIPSTPPERIGITSVQDTRQSPLESRLEKDMDMTPTHQLQKDRGSPIPASTGLPSTRPEAPIQRKVHARSRNTYQRLEVVLDSTAIRPRSGFRPVVLLSQEENTTADSNTEPAQAVSSTPVAKHRSSPKSSQNKAEANAERIVPQRTPSNPDVKRRRLPESYQQRESPFSASSSRKVPIDAPMAPATMPHFNASKDKAIRAPSQDRRRSFAGLATAVTLSTPSTGAFAKSNTPADGTLTITEIKAAFEKFYDAKIVEEVMRGSSFNVKLMQVVFNKINKVRAERQSTGRGPESTIDVDSITRDIRTYWRKKDDRLLEVIDTTEGKQDRASRKKYDNAWKALEGRFGPNGILARRALLRAVEEAAGSD